MGPKASYLRIFGLDFENSFVVFEISTLLFVKHEFLTNAENFGIGPFFKGRALVFSEAPGPGPGPLYKVCLVRSIRLFSASIYSFKDGRTALGNLSRTLLERCCADFEQVNGI